MLVFAFVDFTGFHWNCTLRLDCEDFTRLFRRFTLHSRNRGHSGVDPLILYLNGGPGCSGLNGLFYQSGPLEFNLSYPGHGIPELIHCLHSWTKTANIIFIDVPVGAGFTYATNAAAYASSDSAETAHLLTFMRKVSETLRIKYKSITVKINKICVVLSVITLMNMISNTYSGVEPEFYCRNTMFVYIYSI
ncbi:hypothetical protein CsSME_00047888 [Camellia sinensis var. sinensis]